MGCGQSAKPALLTRRCLPATASAAAVWPILARAQQTPMPVIGFLGSASLENATPLVTALTPKALGLAIPQSILARADEVIE